MIPQGRKFSVFSRLFSRFLAIKKAFTLIEIMIAITILNIGVVFFFNAFTTAMKGILAAQRRVLAVNYSQELMERYVMPKEFNNLSVALTYLNNATTDNFKLQYQVNYANASNLDQAVGSVTDYKRILVTITDNLGIVPSVSIIMLKTDYEQLE